MKYLLFACILVTVSCFNILPRQRRFGGDRYTEYSGGLQDVHGTIASFGDFNSDLKADAFIVTEDKKFIKLYTSTTKGDFNYDMEMSVDDVIHVLHVPDGCTYNTGNISIVQVFPTDINYDGKLDVIVVVSIGNMKCNNQSVPANGVVWVEGRTTSWGSAAHVGYCYDQVAVIDANGDMIPDLMCDVLVIKDAGFTFSPSFLINDGNGAFKLSTIKGIKGKLGMPINAVFGDVDGDCRPDLVLHQTGGCQSDNLYGSISIRLSRRKFGAETMFGIVDWCMDLEHSIGSMSLIDINADGTLDLILPEADGGNTIHMYKNEQKIRSKESLCTADSNFKLVHYSMSLGTDQSLISCNNPTSVHFGDYNINGYPDMIIGVKSDNVSHVMLFENSKDLTFTTSNVKFDGDLDGFCVGAFIDLDSDGYTDLILQGGGHISTFGNGYSADAYFLTMLALNGVCHEWCTAGPKFPSPKPYGVNNVCNTFKYTWLDTNGKRKFGTASALGATTHNALQSPAVTVGLGRTNNYVEYLYYGTCLDQQQYYNDWMTIMPNAQLIAIPHPTETPPSWSLELFISPSTLLWNVAVALSCVLGGIGVLYIYFAYKEHQVDEKERAERNKYYSLAAL